MTRRVPTPEPTRATDTLIPALAELHRIFTAVALRTWPDQPIPAPVITIQAAPQKPNQKSVILGWCSAAPIWKQRDGGHAWEINLSAETLLLPVPALACTLVHVMAHYFNWTAGVKDCSSNQYHNKLFKAKAEELGLTVTQNPKLGWHDTKLGPDLAAFIAALGINEAAFNKARTPESTGTNKPKGKTKMRKWTCNCTTVRCATVLTATCDACHEVFKLEDTEEE